MIYTNLVAAGTAGPGARASPWPAWPGSFTRGPPCRSRSTTPRAPRPTAPPSIRNSNPQLCNSVVPAVRTPHYAAPDRDSCCGLESQPESHPGRSAVAPESAVLAGQIAPPGKSGQTGIAPHKKPGATPRKPAVFWPNRCSSVTPTGRVAPGCTLPSGKGESPPSPASGRLAALALASQKWSG